MRLGQLARKYEVSVQDIIKYLEKINALPHSLHPNARIESDTEALLEDRFGYKIAEEPTQINKPETKETESPQEEILEEENVLAKREAVIKEDNTIVSAPEHKEPIVIESDKLLELLENEESIPDLEKVTLIKAPKKELKSLKIVGKIDLPEPKIKSSEDDSSSEDKEQRSNNRTKDGRIRLSEEEKEARRLKAKQKREHEAKRAEQRKKEQELQRKKRIREAHYKKTIQSKVKTNQSNKKVNPEVIEPTEPPLPPPRTWIGKFLRWLNT